MTPRVAMRRRSAEAAPAEPTEKGNDGKNQNNRIYLLVSLSLLFWALLFYFHFAEKQIQLQPQPQPSSSISLRVDKFPLDPPKEKEPLVTTLPPIVEKQEFPFVRALKTADNKSDPCGGKYIYVHDLPAKFNEDMLRDCKKLSLWTNMCKFTTNAGLGPPLENVEGVFSDQGWYATNQFAVDVIFSNRMKQYKCLTNDSSLAAAIFVPFYAGFDVARYLWGYNISTRDAASLELVDWLMKRPEWEIMRGKDHFLVAGRITWDFRRLSEEETDWGNKLLFLPAAKNMSMLVVEPLLRTINNPYFVRATIDDSFQAEAIASIVKSFGWRSVVAIYVDNELGQGIMPSLSEALEDVEVHRSVISPEASDDQILKELYKLKTEQTRVFVINMDSSLGFRVLKKARKIGMMEEGYVWLLSNGMTHMMRHSGRSLETMQGLLGVRSHVPQSKEREDFSLRWKRKLEKENQAGDGTEPNVFALWAYDSVTALAMAVEKTNTKTYRRTYGPHLLEALSDVEFKGLAGDFKLINRQLESSTFEIINVIGDEERIIGFWTPSSGLVNAKSNKTTSFLGKRFGPVIWPGNSNVVPKGWEIPTSGKKIKVGIPVNKGFLNFVEIKTNPISNLTTVRGYAIDIFEAALKELPYSVIPQYGFEPPGDDYNDLVHQVFDGKWDAIVGDITITSNRSSYVDFTLPYTESGVSMIVPVTSNKNKNAWVFLKPWSLDLWITTGCFFVLIGFVVWLFEHRVNTDFRGPPHHQIGTSVCFSFSTMVFAHREKVVSNLARFVVVVWCFVVLVLTQSYTASLTSFLTVQSLHPTATNVEDLIRSGESVGYQQGGFVKDILLGLKFSESQLKPFGSAEECDDLLSKGTSKGGIAAAFDEVPYLKDIVSHNCSKYAMVEPSFKTAGFKPSFKTAGFGFAFPKNSPMTGDVSRAILKVIQSKEMSLIENKWFNRLSLASDCPGPDTADLSSNRLTLSSFWGLFLISGVASFLALLIFVALFLYEHRHTLCSNSEGSIWRKLKSLFIIFDAKDIKSHTFKSSAVHNVSSPITPCTASPSNVQIRPLQRSMSLNREF